MMLVVRPLLNGLLMRRAERQAEAAPERGGDKRAHEGRSSTAGIPVIH
jgi:hypothetical protein